jgi:flagellar biosynthesis protein FlhF
MQVRVFEATDMATGLKMVKKELGPDALILSTRTVRAGKLGLLGKPMLEITAAIDAQYLDKGGSRQVTIPGADNGAGGPGRNLRSVVDDSSEKLFSGSSVTPGYGRSGKPVVTGVEPDLQSEVNELKDLVKNLAGRLSDMAQSTASSQPVPTSRQLTVKTGEGSRHHNGAIHGDRILTMMVEKGINVETARTIAGFLRESLTDRELSSEEVIAGAIKDTIRDLIQVDPPFAENSPGGKCIALVGPTGVGKTTTLAKIAASFLAAGSSSVALITIDTYRIAAVEQLKVYGEIMDLPVDVVITPEQLQLALHRHRDKDLILIDTAGRSPRDRFCIQELQAFFPPELQIDKHLVLSATTREHELLDTIERFQELGISHTIFTKIDECANLGILLNVQIQSPNPLSYLANGQRVPEDLLTAHPKLTAELIMNSPQGSRHD